MMFKYDNPLRVWARMFYYGDPRSFAIFSWVQKCVSVVISSNRVAKYGNLILNSLKRLKV